MFIAQLDLKKAFDRICHGSIESSIGGCALQLVVLQLSGSSFGTRYLRSLNLGGPGGAAGSA